MNITENVIEDKEVTKTKYIEGLGTVEEIGNLNMQGLIKRLLKSKYITG